MDDAHHFFITICAASVSGGMEINMNNVPIPLTLEEIVIQGGIEGSENAYEDEHGLIILDQTQPFYIMMENLLQDFIMNYFLMEI